MSISPQLEQKIESAYVEMRMHPERALIPIRRKAIYDQLNLDDPFHDQRTFKLLAVITARHILSSWNTTIRPGDNLPEHLINIAEARWNNTISEAIARIEADKAWEAIENIGIVNDDLPRNQREFFIHTTAFEALAEVLGRDPFSSVIIEENDTDIDLDPWSSDTALWAAAAYAGPIWVPNSDLHRRQDFWEWWLKEAIPIAWSISIGTE